MQKYMNVAMVSILVILVVIIVFQAHKINKTDARLYTVNANLDNCNANITQQNNAIAGMQNDASQSLIDEEINHTTIIYKPMQNATCEKLLKEVNGILIGNWSN